ncbi:flagellar protein MotY [Legionella jordanis]|uniref:Sodium-type flagellar protein n=1 Tax=Legionella jordanis TaxID=456 RepID=A0A0W0VD30_9GAMM|nr:OmpA family protein [Legionella jordanis]KTD18014.1 sodium-type flagellar protein [Legionella jordanis]RMX02297.1 OmpA family protein [Legionella jordanis]RMX21218.1 OmpA family protein [Legionella jordanis]VEH13894.1 sodium-type flagellar protein [Legionella jordanis]
MPCMQSLTKAFIKTTAVYILVIHCTFALPVDYENPIGTENWKASGNRLRCGLSLTVPNFGTAYFEQYAKKDPHFIVANWQAVEKRLQTAVYAAPPSWKPGGPSYFISKTVLTPGKFGLYLKRDATLKMLTYLSQGFQASFEYLSDQGFQTRVSLSPIRFQKAYAKYQRCLANLLPFDYGDVKMSILYFDSDSYELSDEAKEQLKKVAEYCRADPTVKRIRIAGYTDDTGRKSYNNAISELRAKAIASFLASHGLSEERLSVTWYGIKDPVAPNDSDEGRKMNRRAIVKIIKTSD